MGSFTAPEDLTLREVRFTPGDTVTGPYIMIVSTDPDLTPLLGSEVSNQFQLIENVDQVTTRTISTRTFQNLSFPLLKGQTLYLGGGSLDIFQLIFS